jgi:hypothetical protein
MEWADNGAECLRNYGGECGDVKKRIPEEKPSEKSKNINKLRGL